MEEKLSTEEEAIKKDYIFFDYKRLAGFFGGFIILFFLLFSISYMIACWIFLPLKSMGYKITRLKYYLPIYLIE